MSFDAVADVVIDETVDDEGPFEAVGAVVGGRIVLAVLDIDWVGKQVPWPHFIHGVGGKRGGGGDAWPHGTGPCWDAVVAKIGKICGGIVGIGDAHGGGEGHDVRDHRDQ